MGSPDQETLQRTSPEPPLATDFDTETAGETCLSYTASQMATGGGCRGPSPPLVVVSESARDVLDESVHQGSETPPPPLWATVPADILGSVLGLLPCAPDRARVRSDWLMEVKQTGECFLVKAFSSEVVHLPCLQNNFYSSDICLDKFISARIIRGALPASPSSVSKYTVVAFTYRGGGPHHIQRGLAIWQPGMTSWCLWLTTLQINYFRGDFEFYQGKLYIVCMYTTDIFAFELMEHGHGVSLSCPEKINPLIPSKTTGSRRCKCNLVLWRGKLLLIIRFFSSQMSHNMEHNLRNVEVFALDFSTSPCRVTIFVQKSCCRSLSTGSYDGVQGDLIYFLDEQIINHVAYTYVHNMRDGTQRHIVAGLPLPDDSGVLEESFDFPVWIFPSA